MRIGSFLALLLTCLALGPAAAAPPPGRIAAPLTPAPSPGIRTLPQQGASSAPQLTRADAEAWLDGFMPYAMRRGDVAGGVVVIVKDGQVLLQKGYGYADVAARKPVDPDRTLFRAGSIGKLFTWTAVMQLVEQGRIDLDADINTYLDFKIPHRDGKPVTMRNLMTHTPGFEETIKDFMPKDPAKLIKLGPYLKAWTPEQIHPIGKVPAYSNYGVALAGYIVQRLSGMSFDDYLEKHVYAPLGMKHTSFRQPLPAGLARLMSKGYIVGSGEPQHFELLAHAPAGSISVSGADMARFMIAYLQKGQYAGGQILKPATVDAMLRTPLTILPKVKRMQLGFWERDRNGHRAVGHGGDTIFFHSDLFLFPDDNVGIYMSVNSGGKEGAAGAIRLALTSQFVDRYLRGSPLAKGRVDARTAAEHARMLQGRYGGSRRSQSNFLDLMYLLGQAKVVVNEDGTVSIPMVTDLAGTPKKWKEIEPFIWREVGGQDLLSARVKDGRIDMFSTDAVSQWMMFTPVPWWKSGSWIVPALIASLAAMALTILAWPAGAIARRVYGQKLETSPQDLRAYRYLRFASIAVLLTFGLFVATIVSIFSDLALASSALDWWVWTLHFLALIVFVGAPVVGLRSCLMLWTKERGWFGKLWPILLTLGFFILLWIGVAFHLIAFSANY